MSEPIEGFRKRLKNMRKIHGWTQQQLASVSGFHVSAISHFEDGRREPSMKNLIKLANALEVTMDYLSGRKEMLEEVEYIKQIATDKRSRVLMSDQCEWLETRLKAIAKICRKILKLRIGGRSE